MCGALLFYKRIFFHIEIYPYIQALYFPYMKERVQKLIAAAGLSSRREAEEWIAEGRVQVNGKTIKLGDQAGPEDKVTVNGAPLPKVKKLYIMLNKPKGYVTTRKDIYGNKTVMDLVAVEERVYPVGRLDKDTTGLLILTNDGEFANKVMHPRYEIQKTYIATLRTPFQRKDLPAFNRGIRLEEGTVRAKLRILTPRRIEVTLHQGYNHVVKRIFREKGYWVADLHRVKIGSLSLDVPPASFRLLSNKEVDQFR